MTRAACRLRLAALLALCGAAEAHGQGAVVRVSGGGRGADAVRHAVAGPHLVLAGSAPLVVARDSTISGSLLVLGRPTYLAGRVNGDVVVMMADVFLRPGADVTGRVTAIGGTVSETSLGRVAGSIASRRDDAVTWTREGAGYAVEVVSRDEDVAESMFRLTGLSGVQLPRYDRVDGLSLGMGGMLHPGEHAIEIEPTVTYRSRLGVLDPAVAVRANPMGRLRFDGRAARDTRSNERWIYGDLVSSAMTFFTGADTRNHFRSDLGEGRITASIRGPSWTLEPFVGGRVERVKSITAAGNVFSVRGRTSDEKIRRPNPLVEEGTLSSALVGASMESQAGVVTSQVSAEVERSVATPAGTTQFLQLTVDGGIAFPTFGTQALHLRVHGVATHGEVTPMARWAYLGGTGTLRSLEILEQGGAALLYVENRYTIPIEAVKLPLVGAPVLTLRDAFGGAGVAGLPALQHEVGIGIGLSTLRLDVMRGVAGKRVTEIGVGIALGH